MELGKSDGTNKQADKKQERKNFHDPGLFKSLRQGWAVNCL
jgi:hypothetical protein